MWQKILVAFWKCISWFMARVVYGLWSRMCRKLFERKYKKLPQDLPWTTAQVQKFFSQCTWKQDALGGVCDIISKPERFYETKTGDCDEYAIFACRVLPWESMILSVTYIDPKRKWFRKFRGHNVCLYSYKDKWYHLSNWGKSGPFDRPKDAWYDVVPDGCIPCAYSMRSPDKLKWVAGGLL